MVISYTKFLVKSLQQRYVNLEVFVIVANVDESAKKFVRED